MRCLIAFLLLFSDAAVAQYRGPAVDACRDYAKKEQLKYNSSAREVVFDRDAALSLERYARKIGSQPVSSILSGNGAVVLAGAPSAELSFICLLAGEKRPVFFYWLPRQNAAAITHCLRDEGQRAMPRPCLELLMQVAEAELTQVYALGFQEARERDFNAKAEDFTAAYRKSNDAWRQYRDAECARRRPFAPAGLSAEDYQLACAVELTQRRALDIR